HTKFSRDWSSDVCSSDLATGGDWPRRGREAAIELLAAQRSDAASLGVRLLADIGAVFDQAGTDRLTSADLAAQLAAIEEAPWGEIGRASCRNEWRSGWSR